MGRWVVGWLDGSDGSDGSGRSTLSPDSCGPPPEASSLTPAEMGTTTSLPRYMFMPQEKSYSPGFLGVNSTVVLAKAGSVWVIPKSGRTTVSEQLADSCR